MRLRLGRRLLHVILTRVIANVRDPLSRYIQGNEYSSGKQALVLEEKMLVFRLPNQYIC